MRLLACLIITIIVVTTAAAQPQVYIDVVDSKGNLVNYVNLGDPVKIRVIMVERTKYPLAIFITGPIEGKLLCKNNSETPKNIDEACGKSEWDFKIPEDWPEGVYHIKVNIYEVGTVERFKDFRVVKPKIVSVNIPEFVYQGKTKISVSVETANKGYASLRLRGNNIDYILVEKSIDEFSKSGDYKYDGEFVVNLRQWYEKSGDISSTLQPGSYLLEVKLTIGSKEWDKFVKVVEIKKPRFDVFVKDSVIKGDQLVVDIQTNRKYDYEYEGIYVTLVSKNFVTYKKALIDENGYAKVIFETSALLEGDYEIYVRDTGLTSTIPLPELVQRHYDLKPEEEYAKILQAQDDVIFSKKIAITKPLGLDAEIYIVPVGYSTQVESKMSFEVILNSSRGVSAFELIIYSSPSGIVDFSSISLPNWATLVDSSLSSDYIKVFVVDQKNQFKTAENLKILGISAEAKNEGEAVLEIRKANVFDKDGKTLLTKSYKSYVNVEAKTSSSVQNETDNTIVVEIPVNTSYEKPSTSFTTPTPTTAVLQPENTTQTLNYGSEAQALEVDYQKVFMFTLSFVATYILGKFFISRKK
ncbi:MAG: hypothetical protein QXM06_00175 [Archaeoglobaceae archaeon]